MRAIVMGCGRVGATLATHLSTDGHEVCLLDRDPESRELLPTSFSGRFLVGNGYNRELLEQAGIATADAFVAVTSGDNTNIVGARIAKEDVEIAGQRIRAGEVLLMNLPAGNRDAAFVSDPDTLDLERNARGHVAFGYGIHQCLGQTLARAEMEIALPVLLRRLPDLRLAVPFEELNFRHDMNIYGVHKLPVAW